MAKYFENSPNYQMSFFDASEGLRVGLGVNNIIALLQRLLHPTRRVRESYQNVGGQDDMCMCFQALPDNNTFQEKTIIIKT